MNAPAKTLPDAVRRETDLFGAVTPKALLARGAKHHNGGRLLEAELCYRQALLQDPSHADAFHLLGVVAYQLGKHEDSISLVREAIGRNDGEAAYHSNLGLALRDAGRLEEASVSLERAIALAPRYAEAHNNLGTVRDLRDDLDGAIESYRRALALRRNYAQAAGNLGVALLNAGQVEEAVAASRQAIGLAPDDPKLHNDLGVALYKAARYDQALAPLRRAQQLEPDHIRAHWNESLIHLARGDFASGWEKYEWRHKIADFPMRRPSDAGPLWDGSAASDGRILLHGEQGFGDALQFVRYLPQVLERCGAVTLEVQPELRRLLAGSFPGVEVVNRGKPHPGCSAHSPLLSLPRLFDTLLETVPAEVPYLSVGPGLTKRWGREIGAGSGPAASGPRVGLVWAGAPRHRDDARRSLGPNMLGALLKTKGVRWFSLQLGPRSGDLAELGKLPIQDLSGGIEDFADTAAALMNLDLVISVDTSVAHLAGALGRPVWLLLPYAPDWRWMLRREDSPWYPTMRLFRQTSVKDWEKPLSDVRAALRRLVKGDQGVLGPMPWTGPPAQAP